MGLPQDDPRPRVTMSFLEFNEALERSKAHFLNQQFPTSVHSPFSAQAQGLQQMNWTRRFPEFPQSGHVPAARAPPSQFSMPLSQVSIQLIKTTFVYHFSIYFIPVVRQKYTMAKITRSHLWEIFKMCQTTQPTQWKSQMIGQKIGFKQASFTYSKIYYTGCGLQHFPTSLFSFDWEFRVNWLVLVLTNNTSILLCGQIQSC